MCCAFFESFGNSARSKNRAMCGQPQILCLSPDQFVTSKLEEMAELFADAIEVEGQRRPLTPEEADKLPHIHRLLLGHYGQPKARELWDPLTQLIYSLLSARTKT